MNTKRPNSDELKSQRLLYQRRNILRRLFNGELKKSVKVFPSDNGTRFVYDGITL